MMAKTVQGGEVKITLASGAMVNDAKVVGADVAADNGVIHVIDKVLIPCILITCHGGSDLVALAAYILPTCRRTKLGLLLSYQSI